MTLLMLLLALILPPCTSDDGANAPCVWNAQAQGNGQGQSFIAFN